MTVSDVRATPVHPSASAPPLPVAEAVLVPEENYGDGRYYSASAPPPSSSKGVKRVTRTAYTVPAPDHEPRKQQQQQRVPPGAEPGGVWMKQRYVGPKTGAATGGRVASRSSFPGLLFLCFPMDKRYVYREPGTGGRLLKGSGGVATGGNRPKMVPPGYRGMNT
eukprot:CAMPEP_0113550118 /NCGR_PEP_ID=MMETSP0015_2-20120614/13808_1 /TAXON_ID=2838 /ORGANISM="Odontella" /LENGTH=163 /DNA_ID=CAMNT_0000450897 /DNA_START=248 /DNA_END=739 /DNA_ORIENTATION=- /assembly_acc=CAM_ASM_000160